MTETITPFERVLSRSLVSAHTADLLAVMAARQAEDTSVLLGPASNLASRGLPRLLDLSPSDLEVLSGLTRFESYRILAAIELGRRAALAKIGPRETIQTPGDVIRHFEHLRRESKEHFCVAFLNTKHEVTSSKVLHIGTLDSSPVGVREVVGDALRENAAALVLAHNHPSGDPTPSPDDIAVTSKLSEAAKLFEIDVLDHVIIGRDRDVSLRQQGLM